MEQVIFLYKLLLKMYNLHIILCRIFALKSVFRRKGSIMKKHLIITGPSGCGKTTLIREVLGSSIAYAGGFITERKLKADGSLEGFDIYPAAAAADMSSYTGQRFISKTVLGLSKDTEVFRNYGVQLLNEAAYYPFIMLDEFGGFDVLIPQFRNAIAEVFNLDTPIIAVMKSTSNVKEVRKNFHLGPRFTQTVEIVKTALANDVDTQIIEMKKPGDKKVRAAIELWAEEYINVR